MAELSKARIENQKASLGPIFDEGHYGSRLIMLAKIHTELQHPQLLGMYHEILTFYRDHIVPKVFDEGLLNNATLKM